MTHPASARLHLIELAILLLVAPFALFPSPTRIAALLVIPALWFWHWQTGRRTTPPNFPIPHTPLNIPILLLGIMTLVSVYATYNLRLSIPKISGLVYSIALFYAVTSAAAHSRQMLHWLTTGFLLAGIGLTTLALLGTHWTAKFPILTDLINRLPTIPQAIPSAENGFHPNEVAGALLWFLPLALAVFTMSLKQLFTMRTSNLLPLLGSAITLFLMGGVLLLTQSRSALLGLAIGIWGMTIWLGWPGKITTLVVFLSAIILLNQTGIAHFWGILFGTITLESIGSIDLLGRTEIWSRAIYGIQDFPLTGMGMNTFRQVIYTHYPPFTIPPSFDLGHAHNHFLQVALDIGLPGLVAYIAIWLLTFSMTINTIHTTHAPWLHTLSLGIFGALLAYFVYGFTDSISLGAKPGAAFWMLLALATATWQHNHTTTSPAQTV